MKFDDNWRHALREVLDLRLVTLGKQPLTLELLIYLLVVVVLLIYASGKLQRWLVERVLARHNVRDGVRQAIGRLVRYATIAIGFVIILSTAGIDLSALGVLAGTIGIGVGLGLQNIATNVFAGVVILIERPIKVGDRVDVGSNIIGDVVDIAIRTTTLRTADNLTVIVPNSDLISAKVVNWTYADGPVRIVVPVEVHGSEDPDRIARLLLEAAHAQDGVLAEPAPEVLFGGVKAGAASFEILVWTRAFTHRPRHLASGVQHAALQALRAQQVRLFGV